MPVQSYEKHETTSLGATHSLRLALPPPSTLTAKPNSVAKNISPYPSNIYKRRSAQNHSTLNITTTKPSYYHSTSHTTASISVTPPLSLLQQRKKSKQNQIYFTKNDLLILMVFIKQKQKKTSLRSFRNLGSQIHFMSVYGIYVVNDPTRLEHGHS